MQDLAGQAVVLKGLESKALNGCSGTCQTFDHKTRRWTILLDDGNGSTGVFRIRNVKAVQVDLRHNSFWMWFEESTAPDLSAYPCKNVSMAIFSLRSIDV